MPAVMRRRRLAAALAVAATLVAVGCGSDDGGTSDAPEEPVAGTADPGLQHIHGLGVRDGTLYIATHTGLWTAPAGKTKAARFGDSRQDIMGFSIAGERRFVGSGHPDPSQADMPPNLGLIESSDGGRTWRNISLLGEADFHVLESAGRRVYGVNSADGALMVSSDGGRSWERRTPPGGVFSLAIDPASSDRIIVSTDGGVFASPNGGKGWRALSKDVAGLLAWPSADRLFLVGGDGSVQRSGDGGRNWQAVGNIGGQPAAFIASGSELYAALHDGTVKRSTNGGSSWSLRATP